MSTSLLGNMRGPRLRTPLLLLLLLLSSLTGKVFCQEEDEDQEKTPQTTKESEVDDATTSGAGLTTSFTTTTLDSGVIDEGSGSENFPVDTSSVNSTGPPGEEEPLIPLNILIPVALAALVIIAVVCGIFIKRSCNNKTNQDPDKEDPYLEASSTEKVPMPMFEEDVPSVLELEMDELGQWVKKDS